MQDTDTMSHTKLYDIKKSLQGLTNNYGFLYIINMCQAKADALQQELLNGALTDQASVFRVERVRGEMQGLLSLGSCLQDALDNVEHEMDNTKEKEDVS